MFVSFLIFTTFVCLVSSTHLYGITEIQKKCKSFNYDGMGDLKSFDVDCPTNIGGGGGVKLQTQAVKLNAMFFTYSEYASGKINMLDTNTGQVTPFVDVATQKEKCARGISWMNYDAETNAIMVLCHGQSFQPWPLYAIDVASKKVNLVSQLEKGGLLEAFACKNYKSQFCYSMTWGTGESWVILHTYDLKSGKHVEARNIKRNPVPAYNNLIGFFVANTPNSSNGTLFAHFEWFSDVRAKPDYTVLFQIEPNEFATTIANLTLAPVNQKLIADAEPYHGTYTDETQTYSYFSACWNCYAQTAKPRVPLAVVKLDFSNPKQYSARNEYVEDLLDKFPPAANVVVASSG